MEICQFLNMMDCFVLLTKLRALFVNIIDIDARSTDAIAQSSMTMTMTKIVILTISCLFRAPKIKNKILDGNFCRWKVQRCEIFFKNWIKRKHVGKLYFYKENSITSCYNACVLPVHMHILTLSSWNNAW